MTAASQELEHVLSELAKQPIPSVLRIEQCAQEARRMRIELHNAKRQLLELPTHDESLDAFAKALEDEIASPSLGSNPPIIHKYATQLRDLEQSVRNFIALVQEPGIMDVDEWKGWSRRVVFDAKASLEKLNGK